VGKYGKLPNYVKISGYKFSMPEYLYLVSKTIQYKTKNNKSSIAVKYSVSDPQHIRGSSIYGNISFKTFYSYVKEVISYINYYNVAPNYVDTSIGSIQYQTLVFVFSKVLARNEFPSKISLKIASANPITKVAPKYTRPGTKNVLNSKYKGGSLSKYLKSSRNCQSKSAYIKNLAKKITIGCKTKLAKAKAIYYWVRNNIDYYNYYNTRYGAKKSISNRKGNCVDQSHAIVALCRASKIPARYVHGNCKFVSGNRYGHVWTQILVGKVWYVADASHYDLNGFGVVNNWKVNSYRLYSRYTSLPF
jgi:transglutaminase-like putative cysteine protease